jgi:hypothetical protein
MKEALRNAARLLMMFLIFMAMLFAIKKDFTQSIDLSLYIFAAVIAVLLEFTFFRYFKSSYGCTSWTFCYRRKPVASRGASSLNGESKRTSSVEAGLSNALRNVISFGMAVFLLFIVITGVCESINKILSIEVTGNVYLAATTFSAFLTPLFFRNYQAIGEAS